MVQTRRMAAEANQFEFFGPPGVSVITFGLPIVCYLAAFICNDVTGCPAPAVLHPSTLTLEKLKQDVGWTGFSTLLNTQTFLVTLGYYVFTAFLSAVLPAEEFEGVELRSGGRLTYRLNAFAVSLTILGIAAVGTLVQGTDFILWTFIWKNYVRLLTSNIIIATVLATFVYVRSFEVKPKNKDKRELAQGGQTGNLLYDWFIGRELNPRITLPVLGEIDIKAFMELRPGMTGWIILNLSFVARQYRNFGYVTDSMLITVIGQAMYVLDAQYMESAIFTTIDITTDGFGYMLSFGDLVWLPFTYSWQARYLSIHPVQLGYLGCLGVFAVFGIGYYIFRSTNNEKNRFRTNPNDPKVAHLQSIQTKSGSRLLVSGWWGTARHINYLGDWIMSWGYCLPTGIAGYIIQPSSPFKGLVGTSTSNAHMISAGDGLTTGLEVVPGEARGWGMIFTYFYMLYFAILLIHRERRDDEKNHKKYGKDWEEYRKKVPSRIIPGIY